jgi:hypothetical protein
LKSLLPSAEQLKVKWIKLEHNPPGPRVGDKSSAAKYLDE